MDTVNYESWGEFMIAMGNRAYYVVGPYIAKTIEEKYGREHLAGLINQDARVYIDEYNELVSDDYKINVLDNKKEI